MTTEHKPHSMQGAFASVRMVLGQGQRAMDELGWTQANVMAQSTLGEIERKYERLEEQYETLREAAQALNGAMIQWHRDNAMPDVFIKEHLALTAALSHPARDS